MGPCWNRVGEISLDFKEYFVNNSVYHVVCCLVLRWILLQDLVLEQLLSVFVIFFGLEDDFL